MKNQVSKIIFTTIVSFFSVSASAHNNEATSVIPAILEKYVEVFSMACQEIINYECPMRRVTPECINKVYSLSNRSSRDLQPIDGTKCQKMLRMMSAVEYSASQTSR